MREKLTKSDVEKIREEIEHRKLVCLLYTSDAADD